MPIGIIGAGIGRAFAGRFVIDTTNPPGPPDFKVADLGGRLQRGRLRPRARRSIVRT